jgi:hypothetical protein
MSATWLGLLDARHSVSCEQGRVAGKTEDSEG